MTVNMVVHLLHNDDKLLIIIVMVLLMVYTLKTDALHPADVNCWSDATHSDFNICPGVAGEWLEWNSSKVKLVGNNKAVRFTYSLQFDLSFYDWAVTNKIFDGVGPTSFRTGSDAQAWCENAQLQKTGCEAANDEYKKHSAVIWPHFQASEFVRNCCIYHVSLFICGNMVNDKDPLEPVTCGPWLPSQNGFIVTFDKGKAGAANTPNWTSKALLQGKIFDKLKNKGYVSAVFRMGSLVLILADPGLNVSSEDEHKDAVTPIETLPWALILSILFILLFLILCFCINIYIAYRRHKMLTDETWIVTQREIVLGAVTLNPSSHSMESTGNLEDTTSLFLFANRVSKGGHTAVVREQLVAVKEYHNPNFFLTRDIRKEVRDVRNLDHPNVCRFVGGTVDPGKVYILHEYCPKGSLDGILENDSIPLNWAFRFSLLTDIARGMGYLHRKKVVHGSLKVSNCVVDDRWTCKVTDYGLRRYRKQTFDEEDDQLQQSYLLKVQDSLVYRAPEVIQGEHPRAASDVFSFGIIMVEVAIREKLSLKMDKSSYLSQWDAAQKWKNESDQNIRVKSKFKEFKARAEGGSGAEASGEGLVKPKLLTTDEVIRLTDRSRQNLARSKSVGHVKRSAQMQSDTKLRKEQAKARWAKLREMNKGRLSPGSAGQQLNFQLTGTDMENTFTFTPSYHDLVRRCWYEEADDRPSFAVVEGSLIKMNPNKRSPVDTMMELMQKYSKNLEDLVNQRSKQLLEEKRRTDALLHSILPFRVAEKLKKGERVMAESFDGSTIFFSDIVGFTTIGSRMSPMQIVELLNKLYTTFDSIIERYEVYKVETIGDAYMVVSGVPERTRRHAHNVASMALEIVGAATHFKIPHLEEEPFAIRVGVGSGPVCAGVVGVKMPRYCLFGDTVNTAARMESNSVANRIHIDKSTFDFLTNDFICEPRGKINIKGKGMMETWWLNGGKGRDSYLLPTDGNTTVFVDADTLGVLDPMSDNVSFTSDPGLAGRLA